jgi:bifunctional non-homologous end joining protein LigD
LTDRVPFRVQPMLATLVREPFHHPGWVYEEKYDGYRIVAYKEGSRVTLLSRNAMDRTATFSAVAEAVASLDARTLALDGEVVLFDRDNVSRFQLLQNLGSPPRYAVFDCLYHDGRDLRKEPLSARRAELEKVIGKTAGKSATIFLSARLADNGLRAYDVAWRRGFEGVVAKEESAPYIQGRSGKWLKFKVHQEDEFVIVGYTAPAGSRQHFGGEWTNDQKLRQPVFLGLRDDKKPEDVTLPEAK